MKRTQLYLQRDMWKFLRTRARQEGTTISDLVREAVREKYGRSYERRREAMQAVVGLWRDRDDITDSTDYVRRLRKGKRLRRIAG